MTLWFTDPVEPSDIHSADVDCGNGISLTESGIVSPHTMACPYSDAGVYTVRATVSDQHGARSEEASYQYVIVFAPEGPFVTGGGHYTISDSRRGHFAFNAKFLPGRFVAPNGKATFWIQGGATDFRSEMTEMLVVSADRLQLWGVGFLNGVLGARFRITATDGQGAGKGTRRDLIRIELWDSAGALIYDTQPGAAREALPTTPIDGGNIVIHR
jgi:hypothetical protein